jgi:arabinogalactan endo-1,4-beta-galactosidase
LRHKNNTPMKNVIQKVLLSTIVAMPLIFASCGPKSASNGSSDDDFALGADISWYTEYESRGHKFYNFEGKEGDCSQVMKDCGLNAVRLRVWVDPAGRPRPKWADEFKEYKADSWCDKNDLLVKCKRAKELGLDIMVDFHYSDWWADPGHQPVPHAWADHGVEQLCQDVADHTIEVLTLLKDNGIEPKWVQIGNETSNGMIWPVGHAAPDSCENYAKLFIAGYDALKKVFPNSIGIVHLDNGWNPALYDWNLGGLRKYGAKWDMIGMSLYPYWAHQSDSTRQADPTISDCMENIRRVGEIYQCPVMITEVGFEVDESRPEVLAEGKRQLLRVLRESKFETNGICRGVFYWEPECRPSQYRLGAFTEDGHPTIIMEAFSEMR